MWVALVRLHSIHMCLHVGTGIQVESLNNYASWVVNCEHYASQSRATAKIYLSIGVSVQTPAGPLIARAILIASSFDLPARAIVTNMKLHGCLYCEDLGTTVGGDHLHRYWPDEGPSVARTHASLMKHANDATKTAGSAVSTSV